MEALAIAVEAEQDGLRRQAGHAGIGDLALSLSARFGPAAAQCNAQLRLAGKESIDLRRQRPLRRQAAQLEVLSVRVESKYRWLIVKVEQPAHHELAAG